MLNASLPNIFLASKSFSQSYLADFSLSCIVPHKPMQFFVPNIIPSPPHARTYVRS